MGRWKVTNSWLPMSLAAPLPAVPGYQLSCVVWKVGAAAACCTVQACSGCP
jgi:hypothetical protein